MKIGIIGTGIAGMGCGHFLHRHHELEFYEQNTYIGGHTHTVYVKEGEQTLPVDTGFIVFNEMTYPNLLRLFRDLGVAVKKTDMSFGVQHLPAGMEYSSKHLFAQKKNFFSPRFIRMLFQINRFFSESEAVLKEERYAGLSLRDFVSQNGYGEDFVYQYIVPMSSALWSTPTDITLQYPIRTLVQFFKNHGLLGINKQYQWYTVDRGSWSYRDKLIAPFKESIQTGKPAVSVIRENGKAIIIGAGGERKEYDKVIFACHADQALRLLQSPTEMERQVLMPFQYQQNVAVLHSDDSIMPRIRSTWSAWNYRVEDIRGELTATTIYDMNALQHISEYKNYFLSINDPGRIDPSRVMRTIRYEHPVFTTETEKAQLLLPKLNENGVTYFCGSYFRFGFHEDAFTSALHLCSRLLGVDAWESPRP